MKERHEQELQQLQQDFKQQVMAAAVAHSHASHQLVAGAAAGERARDITFVASGLRAIPRAPRAVRRQ